MILPGVLDVRGEQSTAEGEDDPSFTIVHESVLERLRVGRFAGISPSSETPGWRDGVITAAAPWMTAENPTNSIPRAAEWAVALDGLEEIVRAARFVAAAHAGTGDGFQHGIKDPLVKSDEESDHETEES